MNLHEYQTKKLLKKRAIPIPDFGVASSVDEAKKIVEQLDLEEAVVKIQVHAGGRGKAGGVKFAKTPEEIITVSEKLIGMKMVNQQTGPEGIIAHKIFITKPVEIEKEYYLGVILDRERARPMLIASYEGGVEIEEVAEKSPEKILKLPFEVDGTFHSFQILRLMKFMGWKGEIAKKASLIIQELGKAFIEFDASLLEINPFVLDENEELWAVDAKLTIDDNALYRQPEIAGYYDPSQISHAEANAKEFDLAYIAMDGQIGCMVNGAGLAMATMDIIQFFGGSPANFLDVGGGADKEKVAAGFRIILSDPKVKAVLVNIFGGIMNCATLAEGIIDAAKELKIHVPLVVRMEGTNVERGRKLLEESQIKVIAATDLNDAAEKVVKAAKEGS